MVGSPYMSWNAKHDREIRRKTLWVSRELFSFLFPCRIEKCNLLLTHNYDVWATWEYVTLSAHSAHTFRHCWYWNTFMFSSRTVTKCRNSRKMQKVHAAWLISRVATFVRKTRRDEKMKYKIQKYWNNKEINASKSCEWVRSADVNRDRQRKIVQDLAGSSTGAADESVVQLSPHSISAQPPLQLQHRLQLVACAQLTEERQVSSLKSSLLVFFGVPGLINASMLVLHNHNDDDDRNQMIITGMSTRLRMRMRLELRLLLWGGGEASVNAPRWLCESFVFMLISFYDPRCDASKQIHVNKRITKRINESYPRAADRSRHRDTEQGIQRDRLPD